MIQLFTGCGTTPIQPAIVDVKGIKNPTVGWSGYTIVGCADAENVELLRLNMQRMINHFSFLD
jgi:hypothetical protein